MADPRITEVYEILVQTQGSKEVRDLISLMDTTNKEVKKTQASTEKFSGATATVAKSSGRAAQQIQNVGYQFSDFAVQVSGGTSALRAFSQQAPQALAAFGVGSPGLAAFIAGATTVMALLPLLAPVFRNLVGASEPLDAALKTLSDTTTELAASTKILQTPLTELREEFGQFADEVVRSNEALNNLQLRQIDTSIKDAQKGIKDLSSVWAAAMRGITAGLPAETYADQLSKYFKAEVDPGDIKAVTSAFDDVEKAVSNEEIISAVTHLGEVLDAAFGDEGSKKLNNYIKEVNELVEPLAKSASEADGSADAAKRQAEAVKEAVDQMDVYLTAQETMTKYANDQTKSFENQAAVLKETAKYGEDSAEVQAEIRKQAVDTLNTQIQQNEVTAELAEGMRTALLAYLDASDAARQAALDTEAAAEQARQLAQAAQTAQRAFDAMQNATAGLERQLETVNAKLAASADGANQVLAAQKAGALYDAQREKSAATLAAINAGEFQRIGEINAEYEAQVGLIEEIDTQSKKLDERNTAAKAGAKSQASSIKEVNTELKEMERLLKGASDEMLTPFEAAVQEAEELEHALANIGKSADELAKLGISVENVTERIAELRTVVPELNEIGEAINTGIVGALDSLIEQTASVEEAFQQMLLGIIRDIASFIISSQVTNFLELLSQRNGFGWMGSGYSVPAGSPSTFNQDISQGTRAMPMRGGAGDMSAHAPDAVMMLNTPISRYGAYGSYGSYSAVGSSGSSNSGVNVTVNNNAAPETTVSVNETARDDGGTQIDIMIEKAVKTAMGQGKFDKTMQQNYGLRRRPG